MTLYVSIPKGRAIAGLQRCLSPTGVNRMVRTKGRGEVVPSPLTGEGQGEGDAERTFSLTPAYGGSSSFILNEAEGLTTLTFSHQV